MSYVVAIAITVTAELLVFIRAYIRRFKLNSTKIVIVRVVWSWLASSTIISEKMS